MGFIEVVCHKCQKQFLRDVSWVRQSKKLGRKTYCSRSCAATTNNKIYPKRKAPEKTCKNCGKKYKGLGKLFCSTKCQADASKISKSEITKLIHEFYSENNRIPLKREFKHYKAAFTRFGNWNNAIKAAGFVPNSQIFTRKYVANDGHLCDSLSEKIIDDWLYARKIKHVNNFPYPGNKKYTVDFRVGDRWIEFFGLSGQLKRYDELKNKKFKLARKHRIKLIEIYPQDLFPENKLDKILRDLI